MRLGCLLSTLEGMDAHMLCTPVVLHKIVSVLLHELASDGLVESRLAGFEGGRLGRLELLGCAWGWGGVVGGQAQEMAGPAAAHVGDDDGVFVEGADALCEMQISFGSLHWLGNQQLSAQLCNIMIPSQNLAQVIEAVQACMQKVKAAPENKHRRLMVGVCGIPGSGKTTISELMSQRLARSVVLPMDGFHLERKLLDEEGMLRRGARFTFDMIQFSSKIQQIRSSQVGDTVAYPSFDHKQKDPVKDAIVVPPETEIIIIEGLYILDGDLPINSYPSVWDLRIWVQADIDVALERVAKRHLESGIEPTWELCTKRAQSNDRLNAIYVIQQMEEQLHRQAAADGGRLLLLPNNEPLASTVDTEQNAGHSV